MRERFARSYLSAEYGTASGISERCIYSGDPDLELHLDELVTNPKRVADSAWVLKLLEISFRLIGSVKEWVRFNIQNNPKKNPCTQAFLLDTIGFIVTGKRSYTHLSWTELHAYTEGMATASTNFNNEALAEKFLKMSDSEIYSRWTSHKDGVMDLVETLRLAFGRDLKSRSTETP